MPEQMSDEEVAYRKLLVAVQEACGALSDLARVLLQGPRADNIAARGGIAIGLRRAAALVDGQPIGLTEKT